MSSAGGKHRIRRRQVLVLVGRWSYDYCLEIVQRQASNYPVLQIVWRGSLRAGEDGCRGFGRLKLTARGAA